GVAVDRTSNVEQVASIQSSISSARTTGVSAPAVTVAAAGEVAAQVVNANPNARTLTVRVPRRADRVLGVDAAVAGREQFGPGDRIPRTLQNGAAAGQQVVTGTRMSSSSRTATITMSPSQGSASAPANRRAASATAAKPGAKAATPTATTPATT